MNERGLFNNWKGFAIQNGYEFQYKDQRHFQGTISSLFLYSNHKVIFESRIGKTGTDYTQEWTKLYFDPLELPILKIKTQKSISSFFTKKTDLEKQIQKILKTENASQVTISSSIAFIKFDHILFNSDELQQAMDLLHSILKHLPRNKYS